MPGFNEPTTSLAFSIQQSPGQYALLLGSGVSRAAGIKTGWGITLDLVRKLPNAPPGADDVALTGWYEATFGSQPSYSAIVASLARGTVDRRNLLRPYFEPTSEEKEDGSKQPTKAHRAIASLVVSGYVRVITNYKF